jgi:hypothetical protein
LPATQVVHQQMKFATIAAAGWALKKRLSTTAMLVLARQAQGGNWRYTRRRLASPVHAAQRPFIDHRVMAP